MVNSLKDLLVSDDLLVGISELSKMSGTSPRQLRYWEEKGMITSVAKDAETAAPRNYRLLTVIKVELIQGFLDEGFTLQKADEKAEKYLKKVAHIRKIFAKTIRDVEVINDRYTVFTIGDFEPNGELLAIIYDDMDEKLTYQVFDKQATIDYQQLIQKN
ncbi:MerR family transcriptional regulator [Tetragenococcus koreensis]|uniref:MerR family transcriptional regulator n=1 Tax=Tetragenococcus koreensis TaxID=290335 RepID=A0AAN4UBZ3_9ENTE|nr:MerR family transcriptional regulator [Tetragenococcus koreensis]MCF1584670.1 MerR family transcriptional regulator [Tetragenococcus koreensis]MCF1614300.1 MerR family transcriptional regulator [Tetragenococcus koreensis]MCF1616473.1 MerR family transcriptional regulator [Tetragenococcus koreensis]MCF1619645.1 MerR family transcriptional regulator [Tetragenococcus koreensis]MCF1621405.1 MerR family transcriptional regulator [Tetragenococcus koreensis]